MELQPVNEVILYQKEILKSLISAVNEIRVSLNDQKIDQKRINSPLFKGEYAEAVTTINLLIEKLYSLVWFQTGIAKFMGHATAKTEIEDISKEAIEFISSYLMIPMSAVYIYGPSKSQTMLTLCASYSYGSSVYFQNSFEMGQGSVGECAQEKKG